MNLSCNSCFFSHVNMCRVNPPDPMLDKDFPPLPSDKYPCGEYLDKETGATVEEVLKSNAKKRQFNSLHPGKPEGTHNAPNKNNR
jgi:hypothetical protein